MTTNLRISRQQLAAFLKNDHDAIRQFETLFNTVATPTTATEPEIQIETAIGSADAKAQSASDMIEALATEEYLISSIGLINAQLKHLQDQIDALQQGVQL